MRIAFHSIGDNSLNTYCGGEGRWVVNWIHFLRSLGHEVETIEVGEVGDFDLYFSLDNCESIKDKTHIHNHFSSQNQRLIDSLPCYQEQGTTILSNPYRSGYEEALPWAQDHNITQLFLPMCYPDDLLPSGTGNGFKRSEITWATKDPFSPVFCGERSYIPENALATLHAVIKLSKKANFGFNLLLVEFLNKEAKALVKKIPHVETRGRLIWKDLVGVMARTKVNLPVGGLSGSCLESIFTKSLPLFYRDISFFPVDQEVCLLPEVRVATEQDIYDALETFWFDEKIYNRAWEHYQDAFQEHRTEGLTRNFQQSLEKIYG